MRRMGLLAGVCVLVSLVSTAQTDQSRLEYDADVSQIERLSNRTYQQACQDPKVAWTLTSSRLELSADAREQGERLLESFGESYMTNAYCAYKKARDSAQVVQEVLREEFATSDTLKESSSLWELYRKTLKQLCYRRAKSFYLHDQLCHYYILHKLKQVTPADLAKVDGAPLTCKLPVEKGRAYEYTPSQHSAFAETNVEKYVAFAGKYMARSQALYRQYCQKHAELDVLMTEVSTNAFLLDVVRTEPCLLVAEDKVKKLAERIDALLAFFRELYIDHRIGVLSPEDLAKRDSEKALELKSFTESLSRAVVENCETNVVLEVAGIRLVKIPGRSYCMAVTETTQAQWKKIMGSNPSGFSADENNPVETVSWDDCLDFIERLNSLPDVKTSGFRFRLPTAGEWEFSCRAGSTGDWGRVEDGEGSLDEMGWHNANSGNRTHPVGKKRSNDFGLYDMHGNVWEWTSSSDGSHRVCLGGGWNCYAGYCAVGNRFRYDPDKRSNFLGFRLVAVPK